VRLVRDAPEAEPSLREFERCLVANADLFAAGRPITAARAPGRLDVMGGIADYSGSVVFEATLGRAAVVAYQPRDDGTFVARTTTLPADEAPGDARFAADELRAAGGGFLDYPSLNAVFGADPARAWAGYVLGALPVLECEGVCPAPAGASFLVWSDVPIGAGVASSAALEVAAMHAVLAHHGARVERTRLAAMAQTVENRIVGAPCGIMDQVTSAMGESGKLLALLCRPCRILGQHELPPGVRVFGLASRVTHSVGGSAYARARVAAFMGLKVILSARQQAGEPLTDDDRYLCSLSPADYVRRFRHLLPERVSGAEFLAAHGETTDTVTTVNPQETYNVRAGADHPVFENARVQAFIQQMDRAHAGDRTALVEAGGLMYASHHSYGWNCGLGCPETDLIVDLVRRRGPERGLYGAKITGGGCGGTVAILADAGARDAVAEIAAEYEAETGLKPDLFDQTSPGALAFGARRYRLEEDD